MIIRFFAILFGCLLLANVAMFFWPSPVKNESAYFPKSSVNPQHIRMNKEIENDAVSLRLTAESYNEKGEACYRLGPFMQQSNYELAQAILFNVNVDYEESERSAQESEVYRIFLGIYAAKAEMLAARKVLQEKKILDHFVRKLSDQEYFISLGIYSTQESAKKAFSVLNKRIDELKMRQETVVLPDSYWLHFSIDENRPALSQLKQLEWGERSAKLGKHECKTSESSKQ